MNKKTTISRAASPLHLRLPSATLAIAPELVLEYWGPVRQTTNEKVFAEVKRRLSLGVQEEFYLLVTCTGGPSGLAMSFYDALRKVLKPQLITVGMGDVDSSGIIIFLSGVKRYVTPNTTLLLHPAGRRFSGSERFTASEIEAMAREDRLKDRQYASILAENSPVLETEDVLAMMRNNTVLTPEELVRYGLAHAILEQ